MSENKQYIAIDLKSFYASVECVERNLDPLDTCLVVADASRTDKTICLAVSPALKAFGIPGRPRLFEVIQKTREVNRCRGRSGRSTSGRALSKDASLAVDYLVAPPRMQLYKDYSAKIYSIYLKYIAPEDIHVYSIDEVFMDVTAYLDTYKMTAHQLAITIIRDVLKQTGITATVGIGTNLYLCKVAMDIVAKKMPADADGVRIAELDEMSYRKKLWNHKPLTDFWRVGRGIARQLIKAGLQTMGDVARASLTHEDWFYKKFGLNAELLIDHAWGWEPVTMNYIHSYRPETHSLSSGQVLCEPYTFEKARVVIQEMANSMSLKLVDKKLMTNQIVITVGYDIENLKNPELRKNYTGEIHIDHFGRCVPQHAHATANIPIYTSSESIMSNSVVDLFDNVVDHTLLIRRLNISVNNLISESKARKKKNCVQLSLFEDHDEQQHEIKRFKENCAKERKCQEAVLKIKKSYGKNAILKGINYSEGATQRQRNQQIGGHKA